MLLHVRLRIMPILSQMLNLDQKLFPNGRLFQGARRVDRKELPGANTQGHATDTTRNSEFIDWACVTDMRVIPR